MHQIIKYNFKDVFLPTKCQEEFNENPLFFFFAISKVEIIQYYISDFSQWENSISSSFQQERVTFHTPKMHLQIQLPAQGLLEGNNWRWKRSILRPLYEEHCAKNQVSVLPQTSCVI